jgi:hypothetical protein
MPQDSRMRYDASVQAPSVFPGAESPQRRRRSGSIFRELIVDSPMSLGGNARRRRWELFTELFPDFCEMQVLDLGGTIEAWRRAPVRPRRVVVLNLEVEDDQEPPDWASHVQGDACAPPEAVSGAQYDLVFSNAVLEHVGGHSARQRFAETVYRLADRHWIQTPYRYFPIEPHWLFPGFQFLPVSTRALLARRWPLVHTPPTDEHDALNAALWVELISQTEMAYYFPDSRILRERFVGLTKSLIAVSK